MDLDKIRENLFVGNANSVSEENLKNNGITAVLNVAYELSDPPTDYRNVKQIKVGLGDAMDNNPAMKDIAVQTLKALLYNGDRVLVHCAAGASRSVYVATRALAEMENKQFHDAFVEVQKNRPVAVFGPLFSNL